MREYILITGATSGLGKATAIKLSQKYNLILSGRNEDKLNEVRDLCKSEYDIKVWRCDLGDVGNVELSLKSFISSSDVQVRALIYCAGMFKMIPCKNYSEVLLNETFAVNVFSAALISKVLSSKRINPPLKSIVFVSSNISDRGAKAFGIYGASKSALDGLMRSLAIELAPRIRVNSVLPGAMVTEQTSFIYENEDTKEKMKKSYPMGIGIPDKVIPVIDFLVSDESNWVTGQQFTVDGGRNINITD